MISILDKQFLITRNVACYRRCKQMEYVGEETMVENDGPDGDGWVETHHFDSNNLTELEDNVCEMTLDSTKVRTFLFFLFNCFFVEIVCIHNLRSHFYNLFISKKKKMVIGCVCPHFIVNSMCFFLR